MMIMMKLWHRGSPWSAKIVNGAKNCKSLLLRRLADRDEIRHDDGHLCVADHLLFWWTLAYFSGSRNFRQRIYRTLFIGARRNLAWLGVWPMDKAFLEFSELWSGVPCYRAATCISYSLMHLSFVHVLASPTMGHWGTCPLDFRQLNFFS